MDFFLSQWIKAILVINFYRGVVADQMFRLYFILQVASQSRREESREDVQLFPALIPKLWEQGKVLRADSHQPAPPPLQRAPSVCWENTDCTNDVGITNWAPSFMLCLNWGREDRISVTVIQGVPSNSLPTIETFRGFLQEHPPRQIP